MSTPEPAQAPTLAERIKAAPVTFAILVINLAWFLWAQKQGSTTHVDILLRYGAVEAVHVWSGEYWRLASHMFLHIGWIHLLWNAYAGFSVCANVERAIGPRSFLITYLVSGIAGGCATVITYYEATSAGASGAMFGMIGALLALKRRELGNFKDFFQDPGTRSTLGSAGVWLLIGTQVNFNNRAHIGGLVAGALAAWAITSPRRRVLGPIVALGFVSLLVASIKPGWTPRGRERTELRSWGARYLFGLHEITPNRARGERFAHKACDAGDEDACNDLKYEERP